MPINWNAEEEDANLARVRRTDTTTGEEVTTTSRITPDSEATTIHPLLRPRWWQGDPDLEAEVREREELDVIFKDKQYEEPKLGGIMSEIGTIIKRRSSRAIEGRDIEVLYDLDFARAGQIFRITGVPKEGFKEGTVFIEIPGKQRGQPYAVRIGINCRLIPTCKRHLEEDIEYYSNMIKACEDRMEFLNTIQKDIFSERQYKIHKTLKIVSEISDPEEKTDIITDLIMTTQE